VEPAIKVESRCSIHVSYGYLSGRQDSNLQPSD